MSYSDYLVSYQLSPIVLVGGVAGTGSMPIINILSAQNFDLGILSAASNTDPARFFGQFRVLPDHTLMDNEVATYPVANMTTAANAIITQPLQVALEMLVPANSDVTFSIKKGIFTTLKSTLDKHTAAGGLYNVATPSYIYQGCLLEKLVDESAEGEGGEQVQTRWIWTFMQPLVTAQAAQAAQNQQMAKISRQTANRGNPPGSQRIATGISNPASNIVQNVVPSAANPVASNQPPTSNAAGSSSDSAPIIPIRPGG